VQSQPHREAVAADHLARQGYRVCLPRIARIVRHARRTRRVLRPLFPRYLFVALDPARDPWRAVRGTIGVSALVMAAGRPCLVPAGVVEAFAAAEGRGGFDFRDRLVPGAQVRFLTGPFADRLGRLVTMDDRERVGVLLEILGNERLVEAGITDLLPAGT
jgi:transcriptional antiterminator RfaH